MRALYEIDSEILECVDLDTGEIVDEEKLNALEMERDKKIEGVILWMKDLQAEADAVKAEGAKLYKRGKACENKAEQLKKWVKYALNGDKFKTDRCSVSYRKTSSIVIDDVYALPQDVWKEMSEDWISKSKIKEIIESGKEIKGAHQEERQSIVIK